MREIDATAPATARGRDRRTGGAPTAAGDRGAIVTELDVRASDGVAVRATLFEPPAGVARRGAALVAGAMGVTQGYYRPFAEWLASEGFVSATYDYRGMGASRRGSLRDERANIETWAREDSAAVLHALERAAPGLSTSWVGHSLGGQIVGMTPGHERVERVLTIASGNGYWRINSAPLKRKVWLFWWGAVPTATPLFGYFPGKMLGMVGDLPAGVAWQWRRWCMHPEYAAGAEGPAMRARFDAVKAPVTALSFTDDEMMSEASTRTLHAQFRGAPVTHVRLSPAALGLARVGHFGFFRREMREPLWRAHALRLLAAR